MLGDVARRRRRAMDRRAAVGLTFLAHSGCSQSMRRPEFGSGRRICARWLKLLYERQLAAILAGSRVFSVSVARQNGSEELSS